MDWIFLLIPPHPRDSRSIIVDIALVVAAPLCTLLTIRLLRRTVPSGRLRRLAYGPTALIGFILGYVGVYSVAVALICTLEATGFLYAKG